MKILIFPKDPNPYQNLLYRGLRSKLTLQYVDLRQQNILGFVTFMPLLLGSLLVYRLRGFRIIHIHWVYPLFASKKIPLHGFITFLQIRIFFTALRILNYHIVWTVHDVVPQTPETPDDERLMRVLSKIACAKIVHSLDVITSMSAHGLDTTNLTVIPHGSYVGTYPNSITPVQARAKLGIASNAFVILFFGIVAPYKGVDNLLQVMSNIKKPKVRLIIAGDCVDAGLRHRITQAAKAANIDFYEGHVPDDQVEVYFKVCNVVCLPFTAITTSGSTILALSFGKPIIVPRLGGLNDLPENVGYFYDPLDPSSLAESLNKAVDNPTALLNFGKNAKRYANSISWDKASSKTYKIYQNI